jgi:hypothetical protein
VLAAAVNQAFLTTAPAAKTAATPITAPHSRVATVKPALPAISLLRPGGNRFAQPEDLFTICLGTDQDGPPDLYILSIVFRMESGCVPL